MAETVDQEARFPAPALGLLSDLKMGKENLKQKHLWCGGRVGVGGSQRRFCCIGAEKVWRRGAGLSWDGASQGRVRAGMEVGPNPGEGAQSSLPPSQLAWVAPYPGSISL